MAELPDCFVPDRKCALILERVRAGYDVFHSDAVPYIEAGFLRVVEGPTAGSGYALTEKGEEALRRAR